MANGCCDFVCPTKETRDIFDADVLIWLDTIQEDLKHQCIFEAPESVDFHITEWNDHNRKDILKR